MRHLILRTLYFLCRYIKVHKGKVFINCFHGRQVTKEFNDIAKEFQKLDSYKIFYHQNHHISGIKGYWLFIKNLFHLHSSEILISNFEFSNYFNRQKGQIYFQLWHGVPLKRIGIDSENDVIRSDSLQWTHLVCASTVEENIFRRSFEVSPKIIFVRGHPRVYKLLELRRGNEKKTDVNAILVAPSFDKGKTNSLLESLVLKAQKYQKNNHNLKIGIRSHTNIRSKTEVSYGICDETEASLFDVIEKYDLVITDISSIAFDFGLAGKKFVFVKKAAKGYFRGLNSELSRYVDEYGSVDWFESLQYYNNDLEFLRPADERYISDYEQLSPAQLVKLIRNAADAIQ